MEVSKHLERGPIRLAAILLLATAVVWLLFGVETDRRRSAPPLAAAESSAAKPRDAQSLRAAMALSKRRALATFPDLGVAGSALSREYTALLARSEHGVFRDPEWPLKLATQAAATLTASQKP
jgi:hypothetical protein